MISAGLLLRSAPLRFLVVGGTATFLHICLLTLFIETDLLAPVVSSAVSYSISAIYNYLLNYYVTFGSAKAHVETFPKFLIVAGIGVTVNTVTFAVVFDAVGSYLMAQLVAIVVTLLLNYSLHKYWIYRG